MLSFVLQCRRGAAGYLEQVEIDTAHFKGNFPESCELHALSSATDIDWSSGRGEDQEWVVILPRTKLGPHRQHYFQLENVQGKAYTHVKLTIHPDGGIKRIRIIGRKVGGSESIGNTATLETTSTAPITPSTGSNPAVASNTTIIPVLPLTPEAFAPFGQVIQAYDDHDAAPKGTKITPANGGSASKFHKLSLLSSSYPADANATTGLSVYRCQPVQDIDAEGYLPLTVLERHSFTNQAFSPMGRGRGEGLENPGEAYLVVVAKNGTDDRPDFSTLRAFVASASQGIVYDTGIWRKSL